MTTILPWQAVLIWFQVIPLWLNPPSPFDPFGVFLVSSGAFEAGEKKLLHRRLLWLAFSVAGLLLLPAFWRPAASGGLRERSLGNWARSGSLLQWHFI